MKERFKATVQERRTGERLLSQFFATSSGIQSKLKRHYATMFIKIMAHRDVFILGLLMLRPRPARVILTSKIL